jgi:hypothetical protein
LGKARRLVAHRVGGSHYLSGSGQVCATLSPAQTRSTDLDLLNWTKPHALVGATVLQVGVLKSLDPSPHYFRDKLAPCQREGTHGTTAETVALTTSSK